VPIRKSDVGQTLTIDRSRKREPPSDHGRGSSREPRSDERHSAGTEKSIPEETSRRIVSLTNSLERNWALSAALILAAIVFASVL
jgi:hypothetical protein